MTVTEALAELNHNCSEWIDPDGKSWCDGCGSPYPCAYRLAVDTLAAEIERLTARQAKAGQS